jgi:hypothetical protein
LFKPSVRSPDLRQSSLALDDFPLTGTPSASAGVTSCTHTASSKDNLERLMIKETDIGLVTNQVRLRNGLQVDPAVSALRDVLLQFG